MIRAPEFQLDPTKKQVFVIEPFSTGLSLVVSKIDEDPELQGVVFPSVAEAFRALQQMDHCVVVTAIQDPNRFVEIFNFAKFFAKSLRSGQFKCIVLYPRDAAGKLPLEKLQMYGVQDLLVEPVQERTLLFKFNRAIKALSKRREDGSTESGPGGSRRSTQQKIVQNDPIAIESEVFVLLGGGAKKVQDRWTIRLAGPSPQSGRWVEVSSRMEGQKTYHWQPLDPATDSLHKEEGAWTFTGQKPPEYSGDHWWFSGQKPVLEFIYDGQTYAKKFEVKADSGELVVAKDSPNVANVLEEIQKTFKKVYRKQEVQTQSALNVSDPSFGDSMGESVYEASKEINPGDDKKSITEPSAMGDTDRSSLLADFQKVMGTSPASDGSPTEASPAQDAGALVAEAADVQLENRVSVIQMHFLASELLRKRTSPGIEMAKRFCSFLAKSWSDPGRSVRVELWIEDQKKWVCVSASDGRLSQLQMPIRQASHDGWIGQDIVVSGTFTDESFSLVGRLAVQGKGVASMSPAFLKDVGEASVGILLSILEDRDPAKRKSPSL